MYFTKCYTDATQFILYSLQFIKQHETLKIFYCTYLIQYLAVYTEIICFSIFYSTLADVSINKGTEDT